MTSPQLWGDELPLSNTAETPTYQLPMLIKANCLILYVPARLDVRKESEKSVAYMPEELSPAFLFSYKNEQRGGTGRINLAAVGSSGLFSPEEQACRSVVTKIDNGFVVPSRLIQWHSSIRFSGGEPHHQRAGALQLFYEGCREIAVGLLERDMWKEICI